MSDDRDKLLSVIIREMREQFGMVRWLVMLFVALNALPRDVRPVETRVGRRTLGAHVLPYLQHHNLSIKLPRDNRTIWVRRTIERTLRNAPRPWHMVRGHWRVVEYGKLTHNCRHMPVMVENNVGVCERCELLVRWIPEGHRGDPTIGIVEHPTYKVTT